MQPHRLGLAVTALMLSTCATQPTQVTCAPGFDRDGSLVDGSLVVTYDGWAGSLEGGVLQSSVKTGEQNLLVRGCGYDSRGDYWYWRLSIVVPPGQTYPVDVDSDEESGIHTLAVIMRCIDGSCAPGSQLSSKFDASSGAKVSGILRLLDLTGGRAEWTLELKPPLGNDEVSALRTDANVVWNVAQASNP